jgi:UDP-GlcNAc:undecaprenyl-phosphate GlcNAc-1-phosphate transferase
MADFNSHHIIFLCFFLFAALFTVLMNNILLKFSSNLGIRDHSTTIIRWSSVSKPALGGITFYIVFLIAIASFSVFFPQEMVLQNKPSLALIGTCSLAFIMGLADDAYNTKPLLKFGVQLLCGLVFILGGMYIKTSPWEPLNYALTLFWVIGIMNSINMLDNMDGITTVTSFFIALMFITGHVFSIGVSGFDLFILIGVSASLLGFLFHNWNPSKMFMGDTGSQFVGIFLAYFGIKYFWNGMDAQQEIIQAKQLTLVLIGFMLPFIDTTTVVINRLRRGQSPTVGGKDHTTHNLSYMGFKDKQVGQIFVLFSLISLVLVFVIERLIVGWSHLLTVVFWSYFFIVFLVMYRITRKYEYKQKKSA